MFIISKLLAYLLNPLLWIFVLLVLGFLSKNKIRKKRLVFSAGIMLLIFSNPLLINSLIIAYQPAKVTLSQQQHYSTGILLGGFAGINEVDNEVYFNEHTDRFLETALLYKTGHIGTIIIAAGEGKIIAHAVFREADFAKEKLIDLGVPAADIFVDTESRNTQENAVNAKKIIDSMQLPPPYLLITSAIHMPRAERTFIKAGIPPVCYPTAYFIQPFSFKNFVEHFIPSPQALLFWNHYLREVVGLVSYKLLGRA